MHKAAQIVSRDPMSIAVNALGIAQITAWGTGYYCLGVLAKPIVADTGWSMATVFLGFSVALIVMGAISTWVGRLIDRIGARAIMSVGTILLSIGLLAVSSARSEVFYLASWALVGIGMRCCLYDAAFAALVQVVPSRGRKAISYLTRHRRRDFHYWVPPLQHLVGLQGIGTPAVRDTRSARSYPTTT